MHTFLDGSTRGQGGGRATLDFKSFVTDRGAWGAVLGDTLPRAGCAHRRAGPLRGGRALGALLVVCGGGAARRECDDRMMG